MTNWRRCFSSTRVEVGDGGICRRSGMSHEGRPSQAPGPGGAPGQDILFLLSRLRAEVPGRARAICGFSGGRTGAVGRRREKQREPRSDGTFGFGYLGRRKRRPPARSRQRSGLRYERESCYGQIQSRAWEGNYLLLLGFLPAEVSGCSGEISASYG